MCVCTHERERERKLMHGGVTYSGWFGNTAVSSFQEGTIKNKIKKINKDEDF